MEIHWFWLSCLGLLIAIFIRWILPSRYKGLSSPRAIPIIGHLHLLRSFPHQALLKLARQYGPDIMFLKLGYYPGLVISSAGAAREALKHHDAVFSSRPALTQARVFGYNGVGVVWAPYGDHWRMVRKACTMEVLTSRQVELSRPVRTQELLRWMNELLKLSARNEPVNLTTMLSDVTFNVMTNMLFGKSISGTKGKEHDEAREFKQSIVDGFHASGDVIIGDYIPWLRWLDMKKISRMEAILRVMDTYLQKQVDEHRSGGNNKFRDFLSILLDNEQLSTSDSTIKAVVLDMVAGGTDTTAVTTEWALAELVKNPILMCKVQHELDTVIGRHALVKETDLIKLDYLAAAVKETLRLHPAGPLLYYETTKDCHLKNTFIPAKTRAIVNVYAIGREETSWDHPLQFDPERFMSSDKKVDVRGHDFEVIPFGAGRRMCPGIQLGMTMVQFMLANLLHGFNWKMPNEMSHEDLDMREDMGLSVPRATPLTLLPSRRLDPEAYVTM